MHVFRVNAAPTRGHCLKCIKPRCHLDIRKYSLAHRIVDIWTETLTGFCMVEGS